MGLPEVGQTASYTRTFTDQDVLDFIRLSGDDNPIHVNDDYAAQTRFKQRVVHGVLVVSMLSKVAGTQLPGPGSIYLGQSLKFKNPVFIGDTVTAEVKVLSVRKDKPIIQLATQCRNQRGELLVDGEALIYYEPVGSSSASI